ncbi:CCAAT/enhancer-binding protein zeta-like [Oscarella lobularis]|uniref:CCAAT/enhancer-binding protein zeta-like n=1 Tax=Oscarella lobularis TaxID=121494 RepID=UPI003313535A
MAFTLEEVLHLGGEKDDFELLKDVDEDAVVETGPDDPMSMSEREKIKRLVKELSLEKIVRDHAFENGKEEEEEEEDSTREAESKTKKKKKKKKTGKERKEIAAAETGSVVEKEFLDDLKASCEKSATRLLVTPGGSWFTQMTDLDLIADTSMDSALLEVCVEVGGKLMARETDLYKTKKEEEKGGDRHWLKTVLTSGTLGDRLAGLTLLIQESPVHHLSTIDTLVHMAKKKGKREALLALDTVKQLWLAHLLPEDRRLVGLSKRPLSRLVTVAKSSGSDARDRLLLLWYFEDQLHRRCSEIVQALQTLMHDVLDDVRKKAQGTAYDLLTSRPEQEEALLSLLVNKLGDPERKVASRSAFLLQKLVNVHPNMKTIVVSEVEKVMYRANISPKAQYFAVCFLNQLILSRREMELAKRLVDIYFSFFKAYAKKGALDAKMLGALLSGVNRAFPFIKTEDDNVFREHLDTLFKVVHTGTFQTSVQALVLLYQVMESRNSVLSDRYFQAVYSKLFDPQLQKASKLSMFFNILYKSLKLDSSEERVKAFFKRQLQLCLHCDPPFICSCLYLISEIEKIKPGVLKAMLTANEEELTSEEQSYKPLARNPLYCGAQYSSLWEMQKLSFHFHPSVSHFANQLLQGSAIEYTGDTLQDFALMHFLDRFVYKNPKKKKQDHGGSLMQPVLPSRLSEDPVNEKQFVSKSKDKVREDEVFFYQYFKKKVEDDEIEKKRREKKKKKRDEDESSSEDESGDLDSDSEGSIDFASALKSSKKGNTKGAKPDDESSDDDGFSYEDLPEEEMSDEEPDQYTEQDYEKALLENMSSDEESDEGSRKKKLKKERRDEDFDASSMFAAADDFAHLLEDTPAGMTGSGHDFAPRSSSSKRSLKEIEWEKKRADLTRSRPARRRQAKRGRHEKQLVKRGPNKKRHTGRHFRK